MAKFIFVFDVITMRRKCICRSHLGDVPSRAVALRWQFNNSCSKYALLNDITNNLYSDRRVSIMSAWTEAVLDPVTHAQLVFDALNCHHVVSSGLSHYVHLTGNAELEESTGSNSCLTSYTRTCSDRSKLWLSSVSSQYHTENAFWRLLAWC